MSVPPKEWDKLPFQQVLNSAFEYSEMFEDITMRDALANPVFLALGRGFGPSDLRDGVYLRALAALHLLAGEKEAWDRVDRNDLPDFDGKFTSISTMLGDG